MVDAMTTRPLIAQYGLALARVASTRSTCLRRSVGCVLLDQFGRVLSIGYNGVPSDCPHCNEVTGELNGRPVYGNACPGARSQSGTHLDDCYAIHAEQNALLQCRDPDAVVICCVTTSPCVSCTKLLLNLRRCDTIVFIDEYSQPTAKELWERAGRKWINAWLRGCET